MSDLLGKLQSGINRVTFEADKTTRITKARSELSGLKKSLETYYREAGQRFYELHSAGEVDHEQVSEICARIAEQLQRISDKEKEIETIKAEAFVATMPSVAPVCTSSAGQAEPAAKARAGVQTSTVGASVPRSSSDVDQEVKSCPNCDASAPVEAVFCPRCGSRFPDAS